MRIYAAVMCVGGEARRNVNMKVLVGCWLPSLLVITCRTAMTFCDWRASRISSSEQSRRSRQRMTPLQVFRPRCSDTLTSTSSHFVSDMAKLYWALLLTSRSSTPDRSLFADLMSPMADVAYFWVANTDWVSCTCLSTGSTTRKGANEDGGSSSELESEFSFRFFSSFDGGVFLFRLLISNLKIHPTLTHRHRPVQQGSSKHGQSPGAQNQGFK